MQQYHRKRHRLMWMIIGPLVVVVLFLAILNRPKWPEMDALPGTNSARESGK